MTDHDHCPRCDCEHPQAIAHDGHRYCGRCWVVDGVLSEMVPCTQAFCGDDG